MPRRKASRMPAKPPPPRLAEDGPVAEMDEEKRQDKVRLLLEDFDRQVEERKAMMEEELKKIQESIQSIYRMVLMQTPEATKNMLWADHIKQSEGEKRGAARESLANIMCSAENLLQAGPKKRGRPPKMKLCVDQDGFVAPQTTRGRRTKAQGENLPPPSTARSSRTRKALAEVPQTPTNQGIPASFTSNLFVTPKFDPRTPLPPGTKRKPKLGEIAISLTGSPLQVSPQPQNPDIKDLMKMLDDNMDEATKAELRDFHNKVGRLLNM